MEANCACIFWKCWHWDRTLLRNSSRPKGAEKINATRRLQVEQNSKTIPRQLEIIEGCGEYDRTQGQRLGLQTNEDVGNGRWHYKCFERRSLRGRSWLSLACIPNSSPRKKQTRPSVWQCALPKPLFQTSQGLPRSLRGPGMGFFCHCQCSWTDSSGALWESDLAGATLLPAWQLLPLIPGTSGLKIAVKVTLVYRRKMSKYTFWTWRNK